MRYNSNQAQIARVKMTQKQLILLCGMSYSGKTTFREHHFKNFMCLSTDDIIHKMAKDENVDYSTAFSRHVTVAQKIVNSSLQDSRFDTVVDQTNLTVSSRARKLHLAKGRRKIAIYWPIPDIATLANRVLSRPNQVVKPTYLESQINSFTTPSLEEGFDEVHLYSEYNGAM